MTRTDPQRYPDIGTALWWAASTVTTVGYGDVVPASTAGRVVGGALMFVGIGAFGFLTAVAASAIEVGEVGEQEQQIEREERRIEDVQEDTILKPSGRHRRPPGAPRRSIVPDLKGRP